ncbi:hypothetical protein CHLRE_12g559704v5 [Chlamydomonas reinhardtii]|uniref:Uncharacterized protein n=1 Tax=Chlamydomonas reinhardtii TaxID=3055 RepID=A0A2K3D5K5_CHLRE|nr:uncharacterized protein CHLRE_12g559704v5 [Chlamydomonas reinhardtii]PNW75811.1 hypothetical protein CHLRE_12g559704v5 [Chlamydomonas reinhardtii]
MNSAESGVRTRVMGSFALLFLGFLMGSCLDSRTMVRVSLCFSASHEAQGRGQAGPSEPLARYSRANARTCSGE